MMILILVLVLEALINKLCVLHSMLSDKAKGRSQCDNSMMQRYPRISKVREWCSCADNGERASADRSLSFGFGLDRPKFNPSALFAVA